MKNNISINGFNMDTGFVHGRQVMSSDLEHHQLSFSVAKAACEAFGIPFDKSAPEKLKELSKASKNRVDEIVKESRERLKNSLVNLSDELLSILKSINEKENGQSSSD